MASPIEARVSWTCRSIARSGEACDDEARRGRLGGRSAARRGRQPRLRHSRRPQPRHLRRPAAAAGYHAHPRAPRTGCGLHGRWVRPLVGPPRRRGRHPRPRRHECAYAARRLERARRPLLIAGGGVIASGAERELLALARRLDAPVLTTVMGRGSVPEDDPVWHAVLPNKRAAEGVISEADVVFAVGCRFAARSTQ